MPAPKPANAADDQPSLPSPALVASPAPEAQTAVDSKTAPAADSSVFLELIDCINGQRQSNGKKPFVLADLRLLRQEAAKANITADDAARWILERPSRNFFRSDYFSPPAVPTVPAPVAPAVPPHPPAPLTPEQVAARKAREEERAIEAAKAKATAQEFFANLKSKQITAPLRPTVLQIEVAGMALSGPDWAISAIQEFFAGESTTLYRMETACSALGIKYETLRKERDAMQQPLQPPAARPAPAAPAAPAIKPAYLVADDDYEAAREAALADAEELPF